MKRATRQNPKSLLLKWVVSVILVSAGTLGPGTVLFIPCPCISEGVLYLILKKILSLNFFLYIFRQSR
jgi:hypothetical protein